MKAIDSDVRWKFANGSDRADTKYSSGRSQGYETEQLPVSRSAQTQVSVHSISPATNVYSRLSKNDGIRHGP